MYVFLKLVRNIWFSDFSLWFSEKMKLLFWKSLSREWRQINGMTNKWFSFFSEMIFRFLENENEMLKSLPEMMFGGDFGGDIF